MTKRQFVVVRFRPEDTRTYTYHNDGEPVAAGDMLKVDDARRGDGWKRVECVSVTDEVPPFQTKPILGRVDDEAVADGAAEPFQLEN
ncbi:hypothetical protein [Sphingomonas sp.]|jgi:hypothetical protein|uniref:hypothetical protein n=1 Tax=Sphingomonas sp. TaxID=28214 RepID=UPI003BAC8F6B